MSETIGETIEQLQRALRDYIEATYHIGNPQLLAQRRRLLDEVGVIHQRPYLESTPRYKSGTPFQELGLDPSVLEMFAAVSTNSEELPVLIHDPPYQHQAAAVEQTLVKNRSLVVMTGTGSGKTECFLLPILGKLSLEARKKSDTFRNVSAVRAIVLYPMNALVNDQLGRLRLMFGDPRIVSKFTGWAGRPPRFARYTSRTLYPGVRDSEKDQDRLKPIGDYYVRNLELAAGPSSPEQSAAKQLVKELKRRGKWPAKPDLIGWYGEKGSRWKDSASGQFKRCITLPNDPELFTRHEVQENPPDVLVTNYSMLEYMLMRPLERPIFDRTREWLQLNPEETLLLVLDEAHLYRGAGGAEVALLVRRLRMRLGIQPERLQVICTSASFNNPDHASQFGAQLTGKDRRDFVTIPGELFLRPFAARGRKEDAEALAQINLDQFYTADSSAAKLSEVRPFLEYRDVKEPWLLHNSLYNALVDFPPMGQLINLSMQEARPVENLGADVFEGIESKLGSRAVTVLMALGSLARRAPTEPGLLPCRTHSFFRGLPGLWMCMDLECKELLTSERGGPTGKLYSQPRDACGCGARVLELFTCRNCGSAYARAYTSNLEEPNFLWAEPGGAFRTLSGNIRELEPIDLLLEAPLMQDIIEVAEFDLITGRLNPANLGARNRQVYLRKDRFVRPVGEHEAEFADRKPGEFRPCGVCGEQGSFGRSSVQDHQTKGDQPFQALITKQLQVQPPGPIAETKLAPLRGRKVLIFSDSRQTAARLAPNLQDYSIKDALRSLIIVGYKRLQKCTPLSTLLSLEDLYLAVLTAAKTLGVRLRPELRGGESFHAETIVEDAIKTGAIDQDAGMFLLWGKIREAQPPEAFLRALTKSLTDRFYGLESLGLASIVERVEHGSKIEGLPDIPGVTTSSEQRLAVARIWLRAWTRRVGFWLSRMPSAWWQTEVRPHTGKFGTMHTILSSKSARTAFEREWLPQLLRWFAEPVVANQYKLKGGELSLLIGETWAYCQSCRTTQRPFPGRSACLNCNHHNVTIIDTDKDPVFVARKGYYRASTLEALKSPPIPPISLIASEHTAQLNTAQAEEVYSKAEENELLFQDVDLGVSDGREHPAVDVLSCTTTMEVGIDIGALSGVSWRNMPPARANYQQRAGRAGRRGNAVATVTAFGSADSHDEHYFTHPDQMIRGSVDDPTLTLDNYEIIRRHVTAYLLQRYHQAKLPAIRPVEQPHLFAVLGKVNAFKKASSILNRDDFASWLKTGETALREEVAQWLPQELPTPAKERLLSNLVVETLEPIDVAIEFEPATESEEIEMGGVEATPEEGEEQSAVGRATENLLDRLLYKGVLPRYAFPTDVATFHVFDPDRSTPYRPVFRFTPSQGLSVALSQYAPGKDVWIGGKLWVSGAIYSPIENDRFRAWEDRRLYYECSVCHFARTYTLAEGERGERRDCGACGGVGTFGIARYWLRPPGFAHPVNRPEGTSQDDQPTKSYATRAKLVAPTPADPNKWKKVNERLRVHHTREHLLVTNRGPREEGYTYCGKCGLIEPTASLTGTVASAHQKPFPSGRDQDCPGGRATRGIVLGTDFITDVLLVSLSVKAPLTVRPGLLATDVALRTLSEALTTAACTKLELEARELQAEYRPALTTAGQHGHEAEIYLYDTLPGGAGFSRRVGDLGLSVFEEALRLLEVCPDNCDRSCYRCLRSYKNKFEHEFLDRHLGASLLRFLLTGVVPPLSETRLEKSTEILYQDLQRQSEEEVEFERNVVIDLPGIGAIQFPILATRKDGAKFVIAIHGPLTPDEPPTKALRDLKEYSTTFTVLLVDELIVRLNLPWATSTVMSKVK